MSEPLLVSVGFALRNSESRYGLAVLELAIASIRDQSYPHLEILVGDNGSTDKTTEVCEAWARVDRRVRVVRHDPPLTAQANFIYLFHAARGKYFTWAADDDFRTPNHLAVLVEALERYPEAALAFSDQREFSNHANYQEGWEVRRPFVTAGLSRRQRLDQMPQGSCTHLCYGLLRRDVLEQYEWFELDNSSFDVPMGYYLSLRAEMVYAPGACYYRFIPTKAKDLAARTVMNNYASPRWFFPERM
ncbi:MAG: glycosyltransferase family 2 protein, partial [Acidobacteria bacterium]|nr:glycosyltransferase family 2 protein [Acidobacteriota bacterium]